MEAFDDSSSDASNPSLDALNSGAESPRIANEVVEDLTGENKITGNIQPSPDPLNTKDGEPAITPRPYQLEMLEESLKRNIIVAVCARPIPRPRLTLADGYWFRKDSCVSAVP